VFPPQTNDFQKPIKFVSTSGKVFSGKESEKASEEKPVEKSSGEKPSEQPQPKPKPKLVRFHCGYCGRDGHKDEFCFKRKRERTAKEWANKDKYHPSDGEQPRPKPKPKLVRFHCGYCGRDGHKDEFFFKRKRGERMAKEWANKDKYHPSDGVLEPRAQMPRAKESMRTVPTWGEKKAIGGAAGRATPVRPVTGTGQTGAGLDRQQFGFRARTGARFGSGGRGSGDWAGEFAGGQIARRSTPRAQYGDGRIYSFEMERRDSPWWFWSFSR
jgi:hypothetical protein